MVVRCEDDGPGVHWASLHGGGLGPGESVADDDDAVQAAAGHPPAVTAQGHGHHTQAVVRQLVLELQLPVFVIPYLDHVVNTSSHYNVLHLLSLVLLDVPDLLPVTAPNTVIVGGLPPRVESVHCSEMILSPQALFRLVNSGLLSSLVLIDNTSMKIYYKNTSPMYPSQCVYKCRPLTRYLPT